jgi:hypothetical protein
MFKFISRSLPKTEGTPDKLLTASPHFTLYINLTRCHGRNRVLTRFGYFLALWLANLTASARLGISYANL